MNDADSTIKGLSVLRKFVGLAESQKLLAQIDRAEWSTELKRRVQHYGNRYDYSSRRVAPAAAVPPLPPWAANLIIDMLSSNATTRQFDQVIVNEYWPGQGIAPHIDAISSFTDEIASLSLGSTCVMTFSRPKTGGLVALLLEPGDLIVLRGEARYEWRHEIKPRKTDTWEGRKLPRGRRVSLTFRQLLQPI